MKPDKRKPETIIAELRRRVRELEVMYHQASREREPYRARATKAEQELAELKRRFDALLERTPKVPS